MDQPTHTPTGFEAHRATFDTSHPDQMTAHLRGEHGWTIFEYEADDMTTLKAMHRCAHENEAAEQHTNCPPETPPCEWCGEVAPLIEPDAIWAVQQFEDGYFHPLCHISYRRSCGDLTGGEAAR